MKRAIIVAWITAAAVCGQGRYTRHNLSFGMGAGQPGEDLKRYFDPSFGISVGYGYRMHRNFQADAGFETLFGAAGVRDFYETSLGPLRIKDYQFLVPLGGRAILPVASGRVLFYGGGGGAYLRYQERIRQPSNYYRIDCPVCQSRGGWGYYGLLGASIGLDRYQRFRFGVGSKVYRGHTQGDSFGQIGAFRTRDRWINTYAELGLGF